MPYGEEELGANVARTSSESAAEKAKKQIDRSQLPNLAREMTRDEFSPPSAPKLARRLATCIRQVAADLKEDDDKPKRYSFEEWAEITRLIRFTTEPPGEALQEEEQAAVNWDWLGENSPMMVSESEPEFVLDRLCESLVRYISRVEHMLENKQKRGHKKGGDHAAVDSS